MRIGHASPATLESSARVAPLEPKLKRARITTTCSVSVSRAVADQAVIVNVPLRGARRGAVSLTELGDRLAELVDAAGVGEFDGDLIGEDLGVLYLYGPDADRLWDAIEGEVESASLPGGSYVVKRYGDPGDPETRVDL